MNISVIGSGYVGLVSGACFADVGNQVLCVDNDQAKIVQLHKGNIPIYEPGLERIVKANVAAQRLHFTSDIHAAVEHAEIIFIAVGTPPDEDGSADLSHVLAVAKAIGQTLNEYRLIVTKSTVPVGTAEKVKQAIQAELDKRAVVLKFSVASNPEFLKEGAAIEDFMKPDRVVIGVQQDDEHAIELLRNLYAPFNRNHERLMVMDVASAELTKYAANAMLATKISFMNELSNVADLLGADIELVRQGIGSDPRIGYHFIYPGCGYGGSCFPKDVQALQHTAQLNGYQARLLEAVEAVNFEQKSLLLKKIDVHFGSATKQGLSGKIFALWGLAFKPNTDDMREAPSRVIIDGLIARGARVQAYDPVAMPEAQKQYSMQGELQLVDDIYAATENADALIVATEWKAFRSPDFARLKSQLSQAVIFDGRNIYEPRQLDELGFRYYGIGRSN